MSIDVRGSSMSDQDGTQAKAVQRPTNNDDWRWMLYWEQQEQPWRTDPEIDDERQKYLGDRRNIRMNAQLNIYPFGGIKLGRADVEWLLATHENGCGPVDLRDEGQCERKGLDLRYADLDHADLLFLPLSGTDFSYAHLENADLSTAFLGNANLSNAHMEGANLIYASLEGANLYN